MKYRRKSPIVEAEQFFLDKTLPHRGKGQIIGFDGENYYVTTYWGQKLFLSPGDWVILDPLDKSNSHAYPVNDKLFHEMYEEVN